MPTFKSKLKKSINRHSFIVGVIPDKTHFEPKFNSVGQPPELKVYAGGDARMQSRVKSELTTGEILVKNMERLGIDLLREPFKSSNNRDINLFVKAFLKMSLSSNGLSGWRRTENLLQAVVRNPILRQDYGRNTAATADSKGFDRHLIDTSQMFQAIKAVLQSRGSRGK